MKPSQRVIFLQRKSVSSPNAEAASGSLSFCGSASDMRSLMQQRSRFDVVSSNDALTKQFVRVVAENPSYRALRFVTMQPPDSATAAMLEGVADRLIGTAAGFQWLPPAHLREVLALPEEERRTLMIGGAVDASSKQAILVLGNFESLRVPFSVFQASGDGTVPDFSKLRISDFGRTICWGAYEASADSVLYEVHHEHRKRLKKLRSANDRTFGACLRRLRLQRRLTRNDFAPVSAKTIARIELGQTGKPRDKTLHQIAFKLKVAPGEIESY